MPKCRKGLIAAQVWVFAAVFWLACGLVFAQERPGEAQAGNGSGEGNNKEDTKEDTKEEASEKPKNEPPKDTDGYDRPTTYPRIRFGGKKKEGEAEAAPPNKSRVFLLDTSDLMAGSITIDGTRETTRIEHMREVMGRTLDHLATRRNLDFNIITFGGVKDFANGGDLMHANVENARQAKEWLAKLQPGGSPDLYALLIECFKQEPDSAALVVGSMPGTPATLDEKTLANLLKKHKNVGEIIIQEVKDKRTAGKKTTLDIVGIGLARADKEYYRRLAEAGGGAYIDG